MQAAVRLMEENNAVAQWDEKSAQYMLLIPGMMLHIKCGWKTSIL